MTCDQAKVIKCNGKGYQVSPLHPLVFDNKKQLNCTIKYSLDSEPAVGEVGHTGRLV